MVIFAVIASAAKQSMAPQAEEWIASSLERSRRRAMTATKRRASQYPLDRRQCFGYHRTMKAGPDIAMVASLVGDPARSNMLTALMTGRALTASELAQQAGITPQTASSHLAKLEAGGLIEPEKQGRHRYYRLTGPDVAGVLEGLAGLADARRPHARAHRAEGSGAAARADLLRSSRRRSRRADARQHEASSGWSGRANRTIELTGEGKRFMAERAADRRRDACPSAPAGVQGLPRLERAAPSSRRHARCRDDDTVHGTEMGRARFRAGEPRGELFRGLARAPGLPRTRPSGAD